MARKYTNDQLVKLKVNAVNRPTEAKNRATVIHIHAIAGYNPITVGDLINRLNHHTNNSNFKDKDQETRNYAMIRYLIDQPGLLQVCG